MLLDAAFAASATSAAGAHGSGADNRSPAPGDSGLRRLAHDDLPQLVDLFRRTFRDGRPIQQDELRAEFQQLYLTSPHDRAAPASLVDVDAEGRLTGFLGIISLRAVLNGRRLRAGVLGNFMAEPKDRARVALRLMRAALAQGFDLVFTDTANRTSLALALAQRYEILPLHSLEWVKLLRPAATGQAMLRRRSPVIAKLLSPIAAAVDAAGRRLPLTGLPQPDPGISDVDIDAGTFAELAPDLAERFALRPDWRPDGDLGWLLDQARRKTRSGELRIRRVSDRHGRLLGAYLLYARSGMVAQALQVLARRGHDHRVVAALLGHAASLGVPAVRGPATPAVVQGLSRVPGIVYHQPASAVFHTRDEAIRAALQSGDALIGGLMGEAWTRLLADEFAPRTGR